MKLLRGTHRLRSRRPPRPAALAVAALASAAAGAAFVLTGVLANFERETVSVRFQLRDTPPPKGIVVVGVDDTTFSDLQTRWPFPRSIHARLVDRLHAAGAKLIVYDVQFTEPTKPAQDLALYDALGRAGGAVLAPTEADARGRTNVLGGDDNLRAIDSVAASSTLPVDSDGAKSRFEHSVSRLRTIAVTAAERAGGPRLPATAFPPGGAWIDYRGGPGTFPTLSFSDVLGRRFDEAAVRGKIVVVGATAPSLQDVHATRVGGNPMSGPEVEANAIWTAMHGLTLRSAPRWLDLVLTLLLALLPFLLTVRLPILVASVLAAPLAAAYAVIAHLAFAGGTILAVASPLAALGLATVLSLVASHATETRTRKRVEHRAEDLEAAVRERTAELRATQLEIVQRLAQTAESRDEETGEHIERIGLLCERLALSLGLSEAEAELIRHASAMHDIGKIGIPDRVLLKPGRLDAEEWELMKTHTTLGAAVLGGSRYELLQLAHTIALTHHERWDGAGYPAGLSGEAIPLAGRICAVCDVYDALVSERPYKRAWSKREALAEIARGAGTHFDPRIARAFLLMVTGRTEAADDPLAQWEPTAQSAMDIRPPAL